MTIDAPHALPARPLLVAGAVVAVLTAVLWWGWLGRDDTYGVDPFTGEYGGPYTTLQVAGCVLSLAVLAVLASARWNPVVVGVVMTVTFTTAWTAQAASQDDTGLFGVGATLVGAGMMIGTSVFCLVGWGAGRLWRRLRA